MTENFVVRSSDGTSDWHIFARREVKGRARTQVVANCSVLRSSTARRPWPNPSGNPPERHMMCPSCLRAASESVSSHFSR